MPDLINHLLLKDTCECCHPSTNMLQLTTPRKQEASGQTSLTSQASGVQQEKTLLLQEQHWGPSKTFFHLGFPSETLDLIAYNEYLFQKDYYDFFYYFEKRDKDSYQPTVNPESKQLAYFCRFGHAHVFSQLTWRSCSISSGLQIGYLLWNTEQQCFLYLWPHI